MRSLPRLAAFFAIAFRDANVRSEAGGVYHPPKHS
jgi:hypothetical protein